MQNPIHKFGQSSIVFEKSGILFKIWKILTSFNYPTVQLFWLKLGTRFLLTNIYKRVCGNFFILFRSWVICKNWKDLVSAYLFFFIINNLRSRRNKTKSVTPFYGHCQQKNIKLCGSWSSPKFSIFQTKKQVSWK